MASSRLKAASALTLLLALFLMIVLFTGPVSAADEGTTDQTDGPDPEALSADKVAAKWTVMVYMDGDNNLEWDAIDDFLELSDVGSTSEVNLLVQLDRCSGFDSRYEDWTGTYRYRVTLGMTPTAGNAVADYDTERNMGDPYTLWSFINWSMSNYQAQGYMLVLWDHGGGWSGVCWDDTNGSDCLTLPELHQAINMEKSVRSDFHLDVLGFDACQMAGMELYAELKDDVDGYFITSQLNEPGTGWNYELSMEYLVAQPTASPVEISQRIADDYVDSYTGPSAVYGESEVTMSVINATKVPEMLSDHAELSDLLVANDAAYHNFVTYCWDRSVYISDYIDVRTFATLLYQNVHLSEVHSRAWALANSTANATICSYVNDLPGGQDGGIFTGIGVYFPYSYYPGYETEGLEFVDVTSWETFLNYYYEDIEDPNTAPTIGSYAPLTDPVIEAGDSQTFSVTGNDVDSDALEYLWYIDDVLQVGIFGPGMTVTTLPGSSGTYGITVEAWDGAGIASHSWTLTIGEKPDLQPYQLRFYDINGNVVNNVTSGQYVTAGVEIGNFGGLPTGAFDVECYVNSTYLCTWHVSNINAGSTAWLETTVFSVSVIGGNSIAFYLDTGDDVTESIEDNNNIAWYMLVVPAKWTVLVYMDGDNNLEFDMLADYLDLASIGSDRNISVVVQMDRSASHDATYGDWSGANRFLVTLGDGPLEANSYLDLGATNMGSGTTLANFIQWGVSAFRADRYMVVIKDHGGSWYGACEDETSGDILTLAEIRTGLQEVLAHDGMPLDVLVFDDCLMGSIEVAAELDGLVNYTVVSETVGWTNNVPYDDLVAYLKGHRSANGATIATAIVNMQNLVDNQAEVTQCVAAYDTRRNSELKAAFNEYCVELSRCFNATPSDVATARLHSQWMNFIGADPTNLTIDLYQFVSLTIGTCDDLALTEKAQALLDLLGPSGGSASSYIIAERHTATASFCHGMSIYFPFSDAVYDAAYLTSGWFGSTSSWSHFLPLYLTYAPPATEASLAGQLGHGDYYSSDVTVTLEVTDVSGSGIDWTRYSVDSGAWTDYSSPFIITSEGMHTVQYYSRSAAGSVEEVRSITVKIDRTAPTASAGVSGYQVWINASDALSGLYRVQYRVDGGAWTTYTGTFVLPAGFRYAVSYVAEDNAGLLSDVAIVELGSNDTTAPTSTATVSGTTGSAGWYVTAPTVQISATDAGSSGVKDIWYRFGTGAWARYVGTISMAGMQGEFILQYCAVDNYGNNETARSMTIKVDTVKPVMSMALTGFNAYDWANDTGYVNATVTEATSGAGTLYYKVNDGAWTALAAATYVLFDIGTDITADGNCVFSFYYVDAAGNVGDMVTRTVHIDMTDPAVSLSTTARVDVDGQYIGVFNATLVGSDAGSGVSAVMYRLDGGAWTEYAGQLRMELANGTHVLQYYATDVLGNAANIATLTFEVMNAGAPGAVVTVTFESQDGGLLLSWSEPDDGGSDITSYIIYRGPEGGALEQIGTSQTASYLDATAEEGVSYQYRVVPVNIVGNGEGSGLNVGKKIKPSELGISMILLIVVVIAAVLMAVAFLVMRRRK